MCHFHHIYLIYYHIINIYKDLLLRLPLRLTRTMFRQSPVPLSILTQTPFGYPSQSLSHLIRFTFLEHLAQTYIDHMSQCGIRCHKTLHQKKADYLPRQYQKYETQQLRGSTSQYSYVSNIVQQLRDIVGTLFMRHALQSPISRVMQCSYLTYIGRYTTQSSSLGAKLESLF